MLMTLYGLVEEYSVVCDHNLGFSNVLPLNFVWSTLLHVSCKSSTKIPYFIFTNDSSTLISQWDDCKHFYKFGKSHPKCHHYYRLGYMIHRCYVLHDRPTRSVVIAQTVPSLSHTLGLISSNTCGSLSIIHEFMKWYEER